VRARAGAQEGVGVEGRVEERVEEKAGERVGDVGLAGVEGRERERVGAQGRVEREERAEVVRVVVEQEARSEGREERAEGWAEGWEKEGAGLGEETLRWPRGGGNGARGRSRKRLRKLPKKVKTTTPPEF
jgi:hypothetical protein